MGERMGVISFGGQKNVNFGLRGYTCARKARGERAIRLA